MKNKISTTILLLALLAALMPAASVVHAQEPEYVIVDIQPDGANMKDAQIANVAPGTNYGTSANMGVGEHNAIEASIRRSLLQFDLSGLPYDMGVISASLTLTVDENLSSNARTMYAYAINNTWNETQVSWNNRITGTAWQTAGASGGNDMIAEPIGSVAVPATLSPGDTVVIPLDPSAVEYLRYDNYFGIILRMDVETDDLYFFRSSDHGTEADRPKLTIEYDPDVLATDPGWVCIDGTYGSLGAHADCVENSPFTESPISPFSISRGFSVGNNVSFGTGYGMGGAKIQCEPYPRCVNDHPIYYRLEYTYSWRSNQANSYAHPRFRFAIPGVTDSYYITDEINCGVGNPGYDCSGVIEGVILPSSLPENNDGFFTLGLYVTANTGIYLITWKSLSYTLYISTLPFSQECSDTWYVPLPETFEIDPTIETPLGVEGEPADHQIYPTVIGQNYMVRVEDGPWHDGTDYRTDAAVSFDGETWISWAEFTTLAFCVDTFPETMENPDYKVVYFEATTENFYIRVNDTTGNFGNNTTDFQTPYSYVIGIAYTLAETSCESQFTYDETEDWIASVSVVADYSSVPATSDLQIGEWYAVEVASGTWHEPPNNIPMKTMEYRFDIFGSTLLTNPWEDLAEGSPFVQCLTDIDDKYVVYIQARDTSLSLRVDDQDDDFSNNVGGLGVNIYHASFNRPSQTCELNFALDQIVRSDSVEATQENGKVFALVVGSALTNQNTQDENFLSYGLVPGAWYALETTGGPWGYYGNLHGDLALKYDLAVAEEVAGAVGTTSNWGDLSEWNRAECNIETDKLGHRLVYFQMPITGALQFKLRVNDVEAWTNNTNSMSWNLYRAYDLGPADSGMCDYSFTPEEQINQTVQTVRANIADGAYISTGAAIGEPVGSPTLLQPNTLYAVELLGEDFKWYEFNGGDPRTDMQLSRNNGTTWAPIPGGGELCSLEDGENLIFFIRTGNEASKFKLRVNSETFDNNFGFMGYNIYSATAGSSINPYDGCVTQGYSTTSLGPIEWIPVYDPMGRGITSTSASYAEIAGLIPGNRYIVEISRGPWYDGETTYDNSSNLLPLYKAQVSSDGGETWNEMNGTNPDVTCWEYTPDYTYFKIEFTVQDGQNWRIRVADTNSAQFQDNTGQLAYTLKGLVQPQDTTVTGTFTLAGCNSPPIFPGLLSVSELLNLGNYLAEWFDYVTGSIIKFFAWCPENTAAVTMFAEDINTKAPFTSLSEMSAVLNDVRNEMNAYSWGATGTDYSVLNKSPSASAQMIQQYVFGPLPSDSPWMDGDLVDFSSPMPSDLFYDNCQLALNNYVGAKLGQGACFAFNWAKQTGLIFWVQLMFDVSVAWACFTSLLLVFKSLVYLLTGVNYATPNVTASTTTNVIVENDRYRRR